MPAWLLCHGMLYACMTYPIGSMGLVYLPIPLEKKNNIPESLYYISLLILLMAEIRPSPVEVGKLSHYLRRVLHIPGGCLGF